MKTLMMNESYQISLSMASSTKSNDLKSKVLEFVKEHHAGPDRAIILLDLCFDLHQEDIESFDLDFCRQVQWAIWQLILESNPIQITDNPPWGVYWDPS